MFSHQYRRLFNTVLASADKLLARESMLARPLRIHLEVNDFCNLKCPHCPRESPDIPKNTGHIPVEAVRRLEPWFRTANYVGLAGNGEPFLHPDIMEILKIITGQGACPSVISNATLWKKYDVFDRLTTLGPMLLMVSFDGGTKATFEKWRLRANFEEVIENLKLLRAARERNRSPYPVVNFIVCLMKDTIDEVEQIVDIAAEAGVAVVLFQNMYPYVKELQAERVLDIGRCEEAIAKARERARPHNIRIDWLPMAFDVEDRVQGGNGANGQGRSYHCDNLWQQIHVTVKGEIKYCCFWTEGAIGDLTKDDFGTMWNSDSWRALRRSLVAGKKPGPCENCHNLVVRNRGDIVRRAWSELKDLAGRRDA